MSAPRRVQVARLAAWSAFLAVTLRLLHGDTFGRLSVPFGSLDELTAWADQTSPTVMALAVVRLAALAGAWYLAAATLVALVADIAGWRGLVRLVGRITPAFVPRVAARAAGVGLAAGAALAVAPLPTRLLASPAGAAAIATAEPQPGPAGGAPGGGPARPPRTATMTLLTAPPPPETATMTRLPGRGSVSVATMTQLARSPDPRPAGQPARPADPRTGEGPVSNVPTGDPVDRPGGQAPDGSSPSPEPTDRRADEANPAPPTPERPSRPDAGQPPTDGHRTNGDRPEAADPRTDDRRTGGVDPAAPAGASDRPATTRQRTDPTGLAPVTPARPDRLDAGQRATGDHRAGRTDPAGPGQAADPPTGEANPDAPGQAAGRAEGANREWTVAAGDSFWSIAAEVLAGAEGRPPSDRAVGRYWLRLIEANRDRLPDPANPDLLIPGQRLHVPPPA